jgi:membrane protease YdiL (CAAX protease family)
MLVVGADLIEPFQDRPSHRRALWGLAFALVFALLPISTWIAPGLSLAASLAREAIWWCFGIFILWWLRVGEGLPLASIGIRRPTWRTFVYGLLGAAALLAIFAIHFAVIVPLFHLNANTAGAERDLILAKPFWYRFVLVLRAAVVEEILFRGYIIEKVRALTGSPLLAIVISVATFTYAHLGSWGVVHLIPVFGGGVIFALLYIRKRDLPANMLAHFITDGIGFLFG